MLKIFTATILFSLLGFAETAKVSLDAHLHYFPEHDNFLGIEEPPCQDQWSQFTTSSGKVLRFKSIDCAKQTGNGWDKSTYQNFLESEQVATAFLISPSYKIKYNRSSEAYHEQEPGREHDHSVSNSLWSKNEKFIPVMDKRVSAIAQNHPGKFIGLCGFNYSWSKEKAAKRVSDCLKLPGMKGVKIHFHANKDKELLKTGRAQAAVEETLKAISKSKPVILWHLNARPSGTCEDTSSACGFSEIEYVFSLAVKYPDINFIIAHSMYEPENVSFLMQLEEAHGARLNNLYLETSATNHESMKDAWKQFGLDRLLYGSDNHNVNNGAIRQFKKAFSPEEIQLIGHLNPGRLLKAIEMKQVDNSERGLTINANATVKQMPEPSSKARRQ